MKKILIDGRFIGVGESISRYTLELLKGILELDQVNEYTLLVRPIGVKTTERWFHKSQNLNPKSETNSNVKFTKSFELSDLDIVSNFEFRYSNLKIEVMDFPHYSLAEQTKLLSYLNHTKYDLVHFTQFNHPILYKRPFVVTIHDLILNQGSGSSPKKVAFNLVMRSAIKDSKKIIAVSKTTKKEILDFAKVPKEKISVIYHGLDHDLFNSRVREKTEQIENVKKKYEISGDYLLYTGAWKRHKNLLRLIGAFEKFLTRLPDGQVSNSEFLIKPQFQIPKLVLVGKIDPKEPEVLQKINSVNNLLNTKYHSPNTIITAGFVEEEELPLLYAGALAYVIPSLKEGFGLPPLEAAACGTPVISSNVSAMPEILGDAALYFDPLQVGEITKAIEKIVSDPKLRTDLQQKGLDNVKKYDWKETAKKTFDIYNGLL